MSEWAAIIYGRTYEVDFRLLTRPKDFNNKAVNWAKEHILATMRSPEELYGCQRWSVFQDDDYCVVGLTCMASDLSEEMNADEVHRPIYVFVGFVTRRKNGVTIPIPSRNLEPFKKIYKEYVSKRWEEKVYQTEQVDKSSQALSEYRQEEQLQIENVVNSGSVELNVNQSQVSLWFDSPEKRKLLWSSAAQKQGTFSLCLGLARLKDVVYGPFLNVSVNGLSKEITIQMEKEKIVDAYEYDSKASRQEDNTSHVVEPLKKPKGNASASKFDFVNFSVGAIGGAMGGMVRGPAGSIVGGAVGGSIGGVVGDTVGGIIGGAAGGALGGGLIGLVVGGTLSGLISLGLKRSENDDEPPPLTPKKADLSQNKSLSKQTPFGFRKKSGSDKD